MIQVNTNVFNDMSAVAKVVTRADDESLQKLHTHMQGVGEGDVLPFTPAQLGVRCLVVVCKLCLSTMTYQSMLAAAVHLSELPVATNHCLVECITCTYQWTMCPLFLTLFSLQEVNTQAEHIQVLQEQKHASKEMQQLVQKLPDVFDHVLCALKTRSASGAVLFDTVSHCSF